MSVQAAYADYRTGRLAAAETKLAAHLLRAPEDASALQLAAMVANASGRPGVALRRVEASLRDPANAHEKLNLAGNILKALGEDLRAADAYTQALDRAPGYDVARTNLAALLLATGRPVQALPHFEALAGVERNAAAIARGRLQALLDIGRAEDALAAAATAALPADERAAFRARALFALHRFDPALGEATRTIGDTPSGTRSFKLALQTLAMTGTWDAVARPLIDDVIARHPDSDGLHAAAIAALHRAGETTRAKALFDRSPRGAGSLAARAALAVAESEFALAESFALDALALANGFPAAMMQLCFASLGLGPLDPAKYDQAQSVADLGLKADPNNQLYYAVKATAGRAKGQDYGYYFDYGRFVRAFDIPAPDGWASVSAFNAALKAELDALHTFQNAPLDQTLRGGTQTSPNLVHASTPAIRAYFQAIRPAIQTYVDALPHDAAHPFLRRNAGGFHIRSGWSVRLRGGGHHVNHVHPEGWISSAYYVDVPKTQGRAGRIAFGAPPDTIARALGQAPEHEVKPKAGRLVLFPSYLWHGTVPIPQGTTRMTLPIDIMPAPPGA